MKSSSDRFFPAGKLAPLAAALARRPIPKVAATRVGAKKYRSISKPCLALSAAR
jgi:hypothetical protein